MLVADVLLILSEKGDLALVETTPEGYNELVRACDQRQNMEQPGTGRHLFAGQKSSGGSLF